MKFCEILNAVAVIAFTLFAFGMAELCAGYEADWSVVLSCGLVAWVCRFSAKEFERESDE